MLTWTGQSTCQLRFFRGRCHLQNRLVMFDGRMYHKVMFLWTGLGIDVAVLTGTQSFREAMMVPCHRPGSISFYPDKWVCLGHSTMGRS